MSTSRTRSRARGPFDLVPVPGFFSHLEVDWEHPGYARFLDRLGSFARLIRFDKRGTGLSDRAVGLPDFETRMDDVRAVMDAADSRRAALFGYSEGGPMSVRFAASYPQRTRALVLYGSYAKRLRSEDYPWAPTWEERAALAQELEENWGENVDISTMIPNADPAEIAWFERGGRASLSPAAARDLILMNSKADVRAALPAVQCPTLVLHRSGGRDSRVEEGRFLADRSPGARFIELPGDVHVPWVDTDVILDEVEEFLTGVPRALELDVRAGVHTGEVERKVDDNPRGIAVHIGARIMSLAGAGEVFVSSTTRDLVAGSGLEFEDRGEHELKGIEGPRRVFATR